MKFEVAMTNNNNIMSPPRVRDECAQAVRGHGAEPLRVRPHGEARQGPPRGRRGGGRSHDQCPGEDSMISVTTMIHSENSPFLQVLEACNLIPMDPNGLSDPYVKASSKYLLNS